MDDIRLLIDASETLSDQTVSVMRCVILVLLSLLMACSIAS
jgi:hypothetical protein